MSKVLLHCCCAPCSAAIIEWMLNNDIEPVLFYYNPNIYPQEEYLIRKNELTRYAERLKLTVIDGDYDYQLWKDWACHNLNTTKLEDFPERGSRCLECFKLRLLEAAKKCKELGLEQFTTTLASSRWKSLDQINAAGKWAAEVVNKPPSQPPREGGESQWSARLVRLHKGLVRPTGRMVNAQCSMVNAQWSMVSFWDKNWRKGGLQDRRNALLKENNFYNQQYCGCQYSMRKED